jgi:hypothetical protein
VTLHRRTVLKAVACAAGVLALPVHAQAPRAVWVIRSGLATDAAFARGAAVPAALSLAIDAKDYGALVAALSQPGQTLFALVDPARALLLHQALRDSGARLLSHHAVRSEEGAAAQAWAQAVGAALYAGTPLPTTQSSHGDARIAMAVRT